MKLIITAEGEQIRQAFMKEALATKEANAKRLAENSVSLLDESLHSLHDYRSTIGGKRTSGNQLNINELISPKSLAPPTGRNILN
jgi:hypothetical protein